MAGGSHISSWILYTHTLPLRGCDAGGYNRGIQAVPLAFRSFQRVDNTKRLYPRRFPAATLNLIVACAPASSRGPVIMITSGSAVLGSP